MAMPIIPTDGGVSRLLSRVVCRMETRTASKTAKGERGIWQRRYWEHTLRDEEDIRRHMGYIHYNPVRHKYVERVADWPYSTFHRYVEAGVYYRDWAGSGEVDDMGFGEA